MSPEPQHRFPSWAERERRGDMQWIGENLYVLWPAAIAAFETLGRGAVVVNTISQPLPAKGNPFAYLSHAELEKLRDKDVIRMVMQYDPKSELVIVLLKSAERT